MLSLLAFLRCSSKSPKVPQHTQPRIEYNNEVARSIAKYEVKPIEEDLCKQTLYSDKKGMPEEVKRRLSSIFQSMYFMTQFNDIEVMQLIKRISALASENKSPTLADFIRKYRKPKDLVLLTKFLNQVAFLNLLNDESVSLPSLNDLLSLVVHEKVSTTFLARSMQKYIDSKEEKQLKDQLLNSLQSISVSIWKQRIPIEDIPTSYWDFKDLSPEAALTYLKSPLLYAVIPEEFVLQMHAKVLEEGSDEEVKLLAKLNVIPFDYQFVMDKLHSKEEIEAFGKDAILFVSKQNHHSNHDRATQYLNQIRPITEAHKYKSLYKRGKEVESVVVRNRFKLKANERWRKLHFNRKNDIIHNPCSPLAIEDNYNRWDQLTMPDNERQSVCKKLQECNVDNTPLMNRRIERSVSRNFVVKAMCGNYWTEIFPKILAFKGFLDTNSRVDCDDYEIIKESPDVITLLAGTEYSRENFLHLLQCEAAPKDLLELLRSDLVVLIHKENFQNALVEKFSLQFSSLSSTNTQYNNDFRDLIQSLLDV